MFICHVNTSPCLALVSITFTDAASPYAYWTFEGNDSPKKKKQMPQYKMPFHQQANKLCSVLNEIQFQHLLNREKRRLSFGYFGQCLLHLLHCFLLDFTRLMLMWHSYLQFVDEYWSIEYFLDLIVRTIQNDDSRRILIIPPMQCNKWNLSWWWNQITRKTHTHTFEAQNWIIEMREREEIKFYIAHGKVELILVCGITWAPPAHPIVISSLTICNTCPRENIHKFSY